jgi:hypothetical protein
MPSFSYVFETLKFAFTAREDEVSFGVYWLFFRRNGMESGLPLAAAAMQLHGPLLILLPLHQHHSGFQDSQWCVREAAGCLKNNKLLWHFPQYKLYGLSLGPDHLCFCSDKLCFPPKEKVDKSHLIVKGVCSPVFNETQMCSAY